MADRPMNRGRKARKKVCGFCVDKVENIDYKDIARLRRYMSERGKILPRRVTGTCADISVSLQLLSSVLVTLLCSLTQLTNLITAFNTVHFVRCFFMLLKHIF